MLELTPSQRRYLRAQAHALNPVVSVGQHGLSDTVIREIAVSLDAHELIKIRIFSDDRAAREELQKRICDDLGAAAIQHIGKLLIIYRPHPEKPHYTLPGQKKPKGT